MTDFLRAALDYAELGWHVFPLMPGQKTPITSHGVKDATTDEKQIREWWTKYPGANIALACGKASGVYVIDVDVSASGDYDGKVSLREFPALPETIRQNTPRGGFHAFFEAESPPANRNRFRLGIDIRGDGYYVVLAPSVRQDGKRYEWIKGCTPWDCLLAEYPDFMRPVVKAPWNHATIILGENAKTHHVTHAGHTMSTLESCHADSSLAECDAAIAVSAANDTLRRASAYLATCDPAIQGQAGHDKLLYAASRMVHGFLLTDGQAYGILASEYNIRCVPPWDLTIQKDERDFRRKISEARKLQPQNTPGWLLNDNTCNNNGAELIDIDIGALLHKKERSDTRLEFQGNNREHSENKSENTRSGTEKDYALSNNELDFLCQPTGLTGEICAWLNGSSLRLQPFLSLAASLTFLGALYGRKIRDTLGSRTNLYCMGVAPSSAGKQHALNQLRNLCASCGCTELLGGDYIASDSAIEERMSRSPVTLFLWDEIGHLLAHIRKGGSHNHAQVVSLLMKLYSSAGSMYLGREYAEKERQRAIIQPCCCIYGTSTPERFTSGISPEELQDGWLSRCLVFLSQSNPKKNRNTNTGIKIPDSIINQVRGWYEFIADRIPEIPGSEIGKFVSPSFGEQPPAQIIIPSTNDSERIFIGFDDESTEYGRGHPRLACLWGKAEENARRIALIVAAGESFENPIVTPSIADYSCRLVRYLLMSFGREIAPEIVSSEAEKNKRRVFNVIKSLGVSGISLQHITRATRWSNQRGRRDILDDLIAAGDIITEPIDRSLMYWTAENYAKRNHNHNPPASERSLVT